PAPGSDAATILDEILTSREIYQKIFTGRNYESNLQRSELMKQHVMEHIRHAQAGGERMPKALFKFGSNHMYRGAATTNTYELGTFLPEIAIGNGSHAFSMLVLFQGGSQNAYRPFGATEADKTAPYDPVASWKAYDQALDVSPFLSAGRTTASDAQVVIDLRPLRPLLNGGSLSRVDARVRRMLLAFDAVVVFQEAHASTLIR
ncbi:MAG: hypothetical protein ABI661_11495, partial [Gammaproteobacteria bacterium]